MNYVQISTFEKTSLSQKFIPFTPMDNESLPPMNSLLVSPKKLKYPKRGLFFLYRRYHFQYNMVHYIY